MKRVRINRPSVRSVLAAIVCVLLIIPCARGQGPLEFRLQVTERANDVLNTFDYNPCSGFLSNDPGPGGLSNALTYTTPAGLMVGDLVLQEPGGGESDLIRWNDNRLVFYSDIGDDNADDSADIGLPSARWPNEISATEVGLDITFEGPVVVPYSENGTNGFLYTPSSSEPGGNTIHSENSQPFYIFISDVPEPGTVTLVGLGLAGLLAVIRRRK